MLEAFGLSQHRVNILRRITATGNGATAAELMAATGLGRSGLEGHLRPLVDAGLVVSHPDPRVIPQVKARLLWEIDPEAAAACLDEFRRTLGCQKRE